MVRKIFSLAAIVLLAFGFLSSCNQLGTAGIIGGIFTNYNIKGGTAFHVLVLDSGTALVPTVPGSVDGVSTVARCDGSYPGSVDDYHVAMNYVITDVPAGTYYVFAWIDWDDSGTFDSDYDFYTFYDFDYVTYASTFLSKPDAANVVVPAVGAVNVDLYMIFPS
jgi:hypothetical protein